MTYRQAAIDADRALMQYLRHEDPHPPLVLILLDRAEKAANDYRRHGDKEKP
jgi:hypothetical protein